MASKPRIDVDIRPQPASAVHSLCVVTTCRGLCYFCSWAGTPTPEQVIEAWREDRRDFEPYDPDRWGGLAPWQMLERFLSRDDHPTP
jgi:hypothetical protein